MPASRETFFFRLTGVRNSGYERHSVHLGHPSTAECWVAVFVASPGCGPLIHAFDMIAVPQPIKQGLSVTV
jgi:hypothetical protein